MKNILLVFLLLGILSSSLFAQQFGIKAGIGFSSIYQTDEINYYKDKLKHESDPRFILSLRINWQLVGNLHIAWEPGLIEKSGKITGVAIGYDSQNNDIYGYREYKLLNFDNNILLNYDLVTIKDILVNVYIGPGISWNISDKQTFGPAISGYPYPNFPTVDYENPYITNNSGFNFLAGVNLEFKRFQFDIRYAKEYSDLWINGIGRYKSYLFCFLIGYVL